MKIAFITHSLRIGGTEKALTGLINSLPEDTDITIFMLEDRRDILPQIKRKVDINLVNIKTEKWYKVVLKLLIRLRFIRLIRYLKRKFDKNEREKTFNNTLADITAMDCTKEKYDAAISFYLPYSPEIAITCDYVKARKKIAWIHYDPSTMTDYIMNVKHYYTAMDKIYCVSEDCEKKFLSIFPQTKNRTEVFHNIIDYESISRLASEYKAQEKQKTTLFTCSRVSKEKLPFTAVDALKILIDKGYELNWYWAGGSDGDYAKKLQKYINENGLNGKFILLGSVENPYPLYSACNVYVQTSLCESYCISLAEAAFLSRKIVSMNFPTAYEILKDFRDKEITEKNAENLSASIEKILNRNFLPPQRLRTNFDGEIQNFLNFISK